jgi:hypothetical protein
MTVARSVGGREGAMPTDALGSRLAAPDSGRGIRRPSIGGRRTCLERMDHHDAFATAPDEQPAHATRPGRLKRTPDIARERLPLAPLPPSRSGGYPDDPRSARLWRRMCEQVLEWHRVMIAKRRRTVMSVSANASPGTASRSSAASWRRTLLAPLLAVITVGLVATAIPAPVAAAAGPKVVVILGPAGGQTRANRVRAVAAVREARRYTSNVVRVFTPDATWAQAKAAMSGAAIVVYIGVGNGFPNVKTRNWSPARQDGLALNPVAGVDNSRRRYYGESYIRKLRLAPAAVVLLNRSDYAPGKSPAGYGDPSRTVARHRVDNYASGFLDTGAAAVIAEYSGSPVYYIRAIFTRNTTLKAIWKSAPDYHHHIISFSSRRTAGATGLLDPVRSRSGYTRSLVGWPQTRTSAVRQDPPTCGASLQARIDAASAGARLDLTGCSYTAGAVIRKALVIVGARVDVPAGQRGFNVAASNVTLDSVVVTGAQADSYDWNEAGIMTSGSISRLVVRRATIQQFGNAGMWIGPSVNPQILSSTVQDTVYAGIMVISADGGRVSGNTVRRVGVRGASANGNNAYGIGVSNEGGALSADVVVDHNTVEDVPTWHALDAHAGVRVSFSDNVVRGAPRAVFITSDSYGRVSRDITVSGNRLTAPTTGGDIVAVTTYRVRNVTVTRNTASGWGPGNFFYDYQGRSTGIVVTRNTVTP